MLAAMTTAALVLAVLFGFTVALGLWLRDRPESCPRCGAKTLKFAGHQGELVAMRCENCGHEEVG